ncbi:serine protease 27-like protein [Leptotrombidium deliense]|uniref:Serine protease 27-like protein n=1 Tax=Leptotrombidium deliense TaxID=299467 RepID=A0A443S4J4_9ACAR|nr:serine protease 27-like protein [Leptotrombidium deliense]
MVEDTSLATIHKVVAVKALSNKSGESFFDDLTLLEVSPPFKYRAHNEKRRGVTSVCLPEVDGKFNESKADLVGFGNIGEFHNFPASSLMTAALDIIDIETCNRESRLKNPQIFNDEDKKKVVCASITNESKTACHGDSGGPLTVNRNGKVVQVGVVSASSITGCGNRQTIFTSVTYYRNWIKDITGV